MGTVLAMCMGRCSVLVRGALWVCLLAMWSACIDPRIPTTPEIAPVVNLPPLILFDESEPVLSPDPITIDIGAGCVAQSFTLSVVDDDLAEGSALSYRFNMVAQLDGVASASEVLFGSTTANPPNSGATGIAVTLQPFTVTRNILNGAFFGVVDQLKAGQTHLLEFHITDDPLGFAQPRGSEVHEGFEKDSAFWLVQVVESNCMGL